nr:MAG TPA: hypothetical protein [Caudoviricetes sp.]
MQFNSCEKLAPILPPKAIFPQKYQTTENIIQKEKALINQGFSCFY